MGRTASSATFDYEATVPGRLVSKLPAAAAFSAELDEIAQLVARTKMERRPPTRPFEQSVRLLIDCARQNGAAEVATAVTESAFAKPPVERRWFRNLMWVSFLLLSVCATTHDASRAGEAARDGWIGIANQLAGRSLLMFESLAIDAMD